MRVRVCMRVREMCVCVGERLDRLADACALCECVCMLALYTWLFIII